MTAYEKKVREYYQMINRKCPSLARFGRNLNLCHLDGVLDSCYHRDEIITTIQKILLRKNKANILLTGDAGCGKTAIAEGVAAAITMRKLSNMQAYLSSERAYKKAIQEWEKAGRKGEGPACPQMTKSALSECVIFELSLNSLVSGARYRGDFEDRVEGIIRECKENPNVVLFIDEVHHMERVGAAEGCVSASQILKPALARKDVRVIGATTTEEVESLLKDKAFARRFTILEVPVLQGDAVAETARYILKNYSAYHNIWTPVSSDDLLALVRYHLPNTVFPDNYINLVDETMASAQFDGLDAVTMGHFAKTLSRMTGHLIICPESQPNNLAG